MSDYVDVLGRGSASSEPDSVIIQARIHSDGDTVAEALGALTTSMSLAVQTAQDNSIAKRDRQTAALGVHQRYDTTGQQVVGYTAYQTVTLTVRDPGAVSELITAMAASVGDDLAIDNLTFAISDTTALSRQARERAMADALAQAEHLAQLASRTLGPVTAISVADPSSPGPSPKVGRMLASDAGMPVEGGECAVTVALRVRVALRP